MASITQVEHATVRFGRRQTKGVLLGFSGLASVIFGILIALWPGAGLLTVIWLIGIYAIVFGVMYLAAYFQSRSLTAHLT